MKKVRTAKDGNEKREKRYVKIKKKKKSIT